MEIIAALGVDQTVFLQFCIFVVAYLMLSQVLFKPYYQAFLQRKERTVGRVDMAEKYIQETKQLQAEFEQKAQEANAQYTTIFEASKSEAQKEYDRLVGESRAKARDFLETERQALHTETTKARGQLAAEVKAISQAIRSQLLGKSQLQ